MLSASSIALLAQLIQLGIAAAPVVEDEVKKAKELITDLFNSKVISIATQNQLHSHCDALQAAALANEIPPAWQVVPDPA